MGVITSNNFDPTRRYVGVRLQQGVPIVDRDWNEMEDIRKFELRAFLKWFIGDGVPSRVGVSGGNDAFKIDSPGGSTDINDFIIRAGGGTTPPAGASDFDTGLFFEGTFLAGGMAAVISSDTTFTSQPLYQNTTLAGNWGVPVIQALSLPTAANTMVVVYLDVWDRLVTPTEDPGNLILPGLGTESCARSKREWAVRTRAPQAVTGVPTAPMPGDPDYLSRHGYSLLATIASQTAGSNMVNSGDITDRRQTRLNLVELLQRVSTLELLRFFPAFDPSPNQFTPKSAVVGESVQLLGTNFTSGTPQSGTPQVLFNSIASTGLSASISGTRFLLSAVVPPGVRGNVTITVITDAGTAVSSDTLNVIPVPTLSQFSPTLGKIGDQVVLTGTNFDGPNLVVLFGNITATVTNVTATQIQTSVPSGATGAVTITVTTDNGSVTSSNTFTVTVGPPAFDPSLPNQFTPQNGTVGQEITLNGTNFNGDNPRAAFLIQLGSASTPATIVGLPTATQMKILVPNVAAGQYKISVTTAQGTTTSGASFGVISIQ